MLTLQAGTDKMSKIDEYYAEKFGTLHSNEKVIAILGNTW